DYHCQVHDSSINLFF
nr:immunoglobulin light chain junction region [Macaca mulatta]MOX32009.1 immunoglobulin light chain junction region [Macaca mulatta]MOX32581.1 immunoglobulin light chain junction region [Macaca mulatta]